MTLCARFDWFVTDRGVGSYPRVNSQVCCRLYRKILCLKSSSRHLLQAVAVQLLIVYSVNVLLVVTAFS